jgi:hypothetical protein
LEKPDAEAATETLLPVELLWISLFSLAALDNPLSDPIIDFRFNPTNRPSAERDRRWELSVGNPKVNRRTRKTGPHFHSGESKDSVSH